MAEQPPHSEEQPAWMDNLEKLRPSAVVGEIEEHLDVWRRELEELEEKAEARSDEFQRALGTRLEQIQTELDETEERLDDLRAAGEQRAEELKGSLAALAEGLREDLARANQRFEDR